MKITGIICEYNPLHLGHRKQLAAVRAINGEDTGIVCLMSGNYVQRGAPAIVDKSLRAKAAVECGADLVLELPVTYALSSAEGFAAGGVRLLGHFCHTLCFGAEDPDTDGLMATAKALLSEAFPSALHQGLEAGLSFPAARQQALEALGLDGSLLAKPNNILAVEYCKAILSQNLSMAPMPILRGGSYHAAGPDPENPSATAVRSLMLSSGAWLDYVPAEARETFRQAVPHSLAAGERAVLARLRTMTEAAFEALPYGAEGLWRKLWKACRQEAALEDILSAVKSKRYTRTRLDRMVMCAFLGLTAEDLAAPAPYARVLAFNDRGREILNIARQSGSFPNIGQATDHPYEAIEQRADDLYGLFAPDAPEAPGQAAKRRVSYLPMPAKASP